MNLTTSLLEITLSVTLGQRCLAGVQFSDAIVVLWPEFQLWVQYYTEHDLMCAAVYFPLQHVDIGQFIRGHDYKNCNCIYHFYLSFHTYVDVCSQQLQLQ